MQKCCPSLVTYMYSIIKHGLKQIKQKTFESQSKKYFDIYQHTMTCFQSKFDDIQTILSYFHQQLIPEIEKLSGV